MREPTKYAEYVVPPLSGSRVDAQWSRISDQLPTPRVRRRVSPLLLAGLACASVLALVWHGQHAPQAGESVWEGSVVASDEAPVNLTLSEGTLIALDPRSQVSLMHSEPTRVQVSLTGGSARFEVAKKRSRRFSVQLGRVEVLVTGTQFHVERKRVEGGERVRVDVDEGSVEVHRKNLGAVLLHAGDHWSAFLADDRKEQPARTAADAAFEAVAPAVPSTSDPVGSALPEGVSAAEEQAAASDGVPSERRGRVKPHGGSAGGAGVEARGSAREQSTESPAELFEQANVARRAGRVAEAAKLFAELVDRHARDHRAALAAFELGRMRMDSLGDVPGAIDALERSLKLDARRAFAEDALARLVLAHEALGDRAACARARERYLARYREGVHVQHIALRCGGI